MIQMLPPNSTSEHFAVGTKPSAYWLWGKTLYIQTIQVNTKMLVPEWDLIVCLSLG